MGDDMQMQRISKKTNFPPRSGFTMIELLVVIALIGVLAALTAGGIFQVIDGQKQSNTEQTMRTLSKAVRQKWERVISDARKETPLDPVPQLAGGSPDRAQIIWIKYRLKQEFPMTFSEVING